MELAIDTSTEITSLSLSNEGEVLVEHTWRTGRNHTTQLLPSLLLILQQVEASLRDITSIIVAKGPGNFNGLRAGIATAKGLSFALNLPLIGVSTLELIAFPYAELGQPICPILKAGRDEVAAALFQNQSGKWRRLVAEHLTNIDNLNLQVSGRIIFCGQIEPQIAFDLRRKFGRKALILQGSASIRRAGYLAELGWRKLKEDSLDDPATLQPLYLRKPSITISKSPHKNPEILYNKKGRR